MGRSEQGAIGARDLTPEPPRSTVQTNHSPGRRPRPPAKSSGCKQVVWNRQSGGNPVFRTRPIRTLEAP
jgi:hypothetical protein